MQARHHGFSLVELAIVLVLVGLLAGGIVAGQSLLRNTELQRVTTDAGMYRTALTQFKEQQGYFAGDMPTATQMWGRADGGTPITSNCATPITDISASDNKATCNGDGDGQIEGANEWFRTWQQLYAAGLITGTYRGISAGGNGNFVRLDNAPAGPTDDSTYAFASTSALTAGLLDSATRPGDNALFFLRSGTAFGDATGPGPIISPKESAQLDRKFDDTLPYSGALRAMTFANYGNCAASAAATAAYQVSVEIKGCVLVFLSDFGAAIRER